MQVAAAVGDRFGGGQAVAAAEGEAEEFVASQLNPRGLRRMGQLPSSREQIRPGRGQPSPVMTRV
jgi:hypothetical protein